MLTSTGQKTVLKHRIRGLVLCLAEIDQVIACRNSTNFQEICAYLWGRMVDMSSWGTYNEQTLCYRIWQKIIKGGLLLKYGRKGEGKWEFKGDPLQSLHWPILANRVLGFLSLQRNSQGPILTHQSQENMARQFLSGTGGHTLQTTSLQNSLFKLSLSLQRPFKICVLFLFFFWVERKEEQYWTMLWAVPLGELPSI